MSNVHGILIVAVMALVTYGIRLAPFVLFGRGSEPPKWVKILGDVLPPAVMSVLLIYCVRNVNVLQGSHGIPEFVAIFITMALHAWKRNTLVSICVGTAIYMMLVQYVF